MKLFWCGSREFKVRKIGILVNFEFSHLYFDDVTRVNGYSEQIVRKYYLI